MGSDRALERNFSKDPKTCHNFLQKQTRLKLNISKDWKRIFIFWTRRKERQTAGGKIPERTEKNSVCFFDQMTVGGSPQDERKTRCRKNASRQERRSPVF
jgi:hypothetical protein